MIERDEVIDRLQAGHRGLQISSDSRRDHVDAMEDLLLSVQEPNDVEPTSRRRMPTALRNAAILLVAFCLGVAGAANSDRVPGDPFYSAKRAAETPAQIVDRDIAASNRLGELEVLIARGADPEIVLTARSDAAEALFNRQSNDPMARALSLLAWPGGLAGRGVDVAKTPEGLLITEDEWSTEGGYTASLADGHLVNISSVGGDVLIGTTGNWTVFTTGTGWQLLNDDVNQVYMLERQGDDFRVTATAAATDPSEADEVAGVGPAGQNPPTGQIQPSMTVQSPTTSAVAPGAARDPGSGQQANPSPSTNLPSTTTALTPSTTASATTRTTERQATSTTTPTTSGQGTTTITAPVTTVAPTATTQGPTTTQQPNTTQQPTTTQQATTTTTQQATTTTMAPQPTAWGFYLQNPGSGNTSSSANLPLSTASAPSGSLANYDTDRDGDPGLMIQKDGAGLSGSARSKTQLWTWTTSSTTFDGEGSLTIWLAAKDFKTDERIGLLAALELCDPGCSRLGTGQWSGSGSSGFRRATISFGSIDTSVPAGSTLRLKVVVPDSLATTDVWFAYDAGSYPSRLTIG